MPKTPKAKPTPALKRFQARLERLRSSLNWVVIHLPFDASKVWGLRGQIKVKGEVNGFSFRTSLFPTRQGRHFLLVNKQMQKGGRAGEGSVARFEIEPDTEERTVTIPNELKCILTTERSLRRWYDDLTYSTRSHIAKWVTEPKTVEARARRAEQIAERLLSVMDAERERELPPLLQVAFTRQPRAREGWNAMSLSRRRGHLFGIFYYRTPEAQARRLDKMLDDATAIAEKRSSRK